jgi:RNA polymerase sigma-70 factor (ECF subfamily)
MADDLDLFTRHRPRLFGVAYRMLASRSCRRRAAGRLAALAPRRSNWNRPRPGTVVTRLCIDRLRQLQEAPAPRRPLAAGTPGGPAGTGRIDLYGQASLAPSPERCWTA